MDILAAETGWVLGNWGANGRELPDAAPDIPADTDLQIVMLGTNDLLQGRRPKATAERMERFLTSLELARGKIPLFALPSRSPGEWVPGQMLGAALHKPPAGFADIPISRRSRSGPLWRHRFSH